MYIAIDIGGTTARIVSTLSLDAPVNFTKKEFLLTHHFDADFSTIIQTITQLTQGSIDAIAMGTPGIENNTKSEITGEAPNLQEWKNQPIKMLLENAFHCPVFLENDAVLAGLGEAVYGELKGENFVYVIWGTGIGGTMVTSNEGKSESKKLDWKVYLELWEKECGGKAIQERFGKKPSEFSEEEWNIVMGTFAKYLARFIEQIQPTTIIFGGGIAIKQSQRLLQLAKDFPAVTIEVSSLGENGGLFGAFALLKKGKASYA